MSDPFSHLIDETQSFLTELAQDNSRDWFAAHKTRYDDRLARPATRLLAAVADGLRASHGLNLRGKLFRPQRDLRFSSDKTPYHTHLHLHWTLAGPGRQHPALFFGIDPDRVRAGGGVLVFDRLVLEDWRQAVAGPLGPALARDLADLAARGLTPSAPPELKQVPAPFTADHPQAMLLRRKGLTVWADLPAADRTRPLEGLLSLFRDLQPLLARLQLVM